MWTWAACCLYLRTSQAFLNWRETCCQDFFFNAFRFLFEIMTIYEKLRRWAFPLFDTFSASSVFFLQFCVMQTRRRRSRITLTNDVHLYQCHYSEKWKARKWCHSNLFFHYLALEGCFLLRSSMFQKAGNNHLSSHNDITTQHPQSHFLMCSKSKFPTLSSVLAVDFLLSVKALSQSQKTYAQIINKN